MEIRELLLPEFDIEMKKTRCTLERVPEGTPDYKPHDKSMSICKLAGHLAQLPTFAEKIVDLPGLDIGAGTMKPLIMESTEQLLSAFDSNVKLAREAIAKADDATLQQPWKLTFQTKVIFDGNRYQLLRTLFLNHVIHHRAQLGVYLRLNNVPVPSVYGPSADESVA